LNKRLRTGLPDLHPLQAEDGQFALVLAAIEQIVNGDLTAFAHGEIARLKLEIYFQIFDEGDFL
jgi:hypothetical protein